MNRVLLRILAAALLLVVSALIGWRVLAPAELSAVATTPYPPLPSPAPGVTGKLNVAPLIVDGRQRVYAAKNQVRADAPVTGRGVYTARWSFRRWPEQLSGVVASGTTVVTRWSDGELVAIDARTGSVAWRADGPEAPAYAGHRTGAATVWTPPGLRLASGRVLVTQDQELAAYDVSTGSVLWSISVPAGCADGFTTAGGAYACATGAYDTSTGEPLTGWPTAPYTSVGCVASPCVAFRDGAGQGWAADGATLRRAPALDDPTATFAAGVVITVSSSPDSPVITGRAVDGAALWTTEGPARVLGGTSETVLLLSPENILTGVDARTGVARYSFPMGFEEESTQWRPGLYRVTEGYLAVERLRTDGPDDPESPVYYHSIDAVVVAALPS